MTPDQAKEHLLEVAAGGIVTRTRKYVEIQLDAGTWDALQDWKRQGAAIAAASETQPIQARSKTEFKRMILTWNCRFCMWANDNNNGPCHRCGGHTEMKMVNGRWKEVTIKEPNRETNARADSSAERS